MIDTYDVEYHDAINDRRYRVVTKPMTVSGGAACDRLYADISKRKDDDGNELDNYILLSLLAYPTLLHGTHSFEVQASEGDWQAVALTEALYGDLSEWFIQQWYNAILEKNPHRDTSYENLKKSLAAISQTINESDLISSPPNGIAAD